jgi:hypothetical protein
MHWLAQGAQQMCSNVFILPPKLDITVQFIVTHQKFQCKNFSNWSLAISWGKGACAAASQNYNFFHWLRWRKFCVTMEKTIETEGQQ